MLLVNEGLAQFITILYRRAKDVFVNYKRCIPDRESDEIPLLTGTVTGTNSRLLLHFFTRLNSLWYARLFN